MHALRMGLGLLAPLLALGGFSLWLHRRARLESCFAPAVACACVALCCVLGALAGALLPVTVCLWALGLALLAAEGWKSMRSPRAKGSAAAIFLIVFAAYAALRLWNVVFLHYDNFSHWALMTDWLLQTDALPGRDDTLVLFTSYPPASAAFCYFFARAAGGGEAAMAFGQAVWIAASGATLFHFVGKRRALCILTVTVGFVWMLVCNVFLDELLVDTLLPMAGLAALSAALGGKHAKGAPGFAVFPLLAALVLIKSSGLFFAIPAGGVLVWRAFRSSPQNGWRCLARVAACVGIALLVWRLHVAVTFAGTQSKHAPNAGAYALSFSGKLANGVLWQTAKNMVKRWVDPAAIQNRLLLCILLWMSALCILHPRKSEQRKRAARFLLAALLLWAAWQAGIFGMYAFSASEREALNLSGQQRYSLSMIVYLLGLAVVDQCDFWQRFLMPQTPKRGLACVTLCVLMAFLPALPMRQNLPCLWRPLNTSTRRAELQTALTRQNVPQGKRYMLYVRSFEDSAYVTYMARYLLRSAAVSVVDASAYRDEMTNGLPACDYLIFADEDAAAQAFAETLLQRPACAGVTLIV